MIVPSASIPPIALPPPLPSMPSARTLQRLMVRNVIEVAIAVLPQAYVQLAITDAQLSLYGFPLNLASGDGNLLVPQEQRCVFFQVVQ